MEYKIDHDALSRLEELLLIVSPTTDETRMTDYLSAYLKSFGATIKSDYMGNLVASFNRSAERTVALCTHIDTVAVQITNILSNGYLQFRPIGPMPHTLLGQRMSILTYNNEIIEGVVGFDPTSQYGAPKGLVFDDLWIDIGDDCAGRVRVGDLAVFTPQVSRLSDDRICGTALDNRVGIFIVTEVARRFSTTDSNVNLEIIATVQEEVGLRGSQIAARMSQADCCIVVDVDYATDTLTPHHNQLSSVRLGRGPVLLHKADNSRRLLNRLADIASAEAIDVQHGVGRYIYGGTDASSLQVNGSMPVANIAIPCRYVHSPVEICSFSDILQAISLITSFLQNNG